VNERPKVVLVHPSRQRKASLDFLVRILSHRYDYCALAQHPQNPRAVLEVTFYQDRRVSAHNLIHQWQSVYQVHLCLGHLLGFLARRSDRGTVAAKQAKGQ
jgi:hypothetical protein